MSAQTTIKRLRSQVTTYAELIEKQNHLYEFLTTHLECKDKNGILSPYVFSLSVKRTFKENEELKEKNHRLSHKKRFWRVMFYILLCADIVASIFIVNALR